MKLMLHYENRTLEKQIKYQKTLIDRTFQNNNNDTIIPFVKQKLSLQNNELLVILLSGYTDENVEIILEFVYAHRISKIYFFIEDVFRLKSDENNRNILDSYQIEQNSDSIESLELNLIKKIIDNTDVDYEIYHCEYNCKLLSKKYDLKIKYFDWFVSSVIKFHSKYLPIDYFFTQKISCFNLRHEWHRFIIAILLQHETDCLVTLNYKKDKKDLLSNKSLPLNKFSFDLKNKIINNFDMIDYRKLLWDGRYREFPSIVVEDISPGQQWNNVSEMKNSFVNVITETRFVSPMPNFSEKTLKSILVYRPFILLAPPGTLSLLKKLGLKTFDQWWDESYDNIADHNKRLELVYKLCLEILSKSKEDLEQILIEMTDTLVHNRTALESFSTKMFDLN